MPPDHLDDVQFEEVDGQPLYCNVRYIDERERERAVSRFVLVQTGRPFDGVRNMFVVAQYQPRGGNR